MKFWEKRNETVDLVCYYMQNNQKYQKRPKTNNNMIDNS